jgi:repressor LexA
MARPISTHLTPLQLRVARMVAEFVGKDLPTFIPELATALKLAGRSSLVRTLEKMARGGFVQLVGGGGPGRSRMVQLTAKTRRLLGIGGLPLLGRIAAGPLSEAFSQAEFIELSELLLIRPGDFLLDVAGDSMTGDGILDGDRAIIRPNVEVPDGGIAAVCVGDEQEATLKHVHREGDQVRLKASNPLYSDILVAGENVRIAGRFKGVVRNA